MSREILSRDDPEKEERMVLDRRPATRVGILLTSGETKARVDTLNSDIAVLDQAVDADIKVMKSHLPNLSAEEKTRVEWIKSYTNFKLDYNSFLSAGIYATDEATLYNFELRFRQLRKTYEELPGANKPAVPISPDPPKPAEIAKSINEGLHSIENIMKWGAVAGIGYLSYRFLMSDRPGRAYETVKSDAKAAYDHKKTVEEATAKTEAAIKGK